MGLFSNKKALCPICGGATPRLLPYKVEDQAICKDCRKKMSIEPSLDENLTLDDLRRHLAYREQNAENHTMFDATYSCSFTYHTMLVDEAHRMFYFEGDEKNPPIFTFDELVRFQYEEELNLDRINFIQDEHRGNLAICDWTRENRGGRESFIEVLREEHEGIASSDRLLSHLIGVDDFLMSKEKPVRKFRMRFTLDNPYWHTLEYEFVEPRMNKGENANEYAEVEQYLTRWQEILDQVEEVKTGVRIIFGE